MSLSSIAAAVDCSGWLGPRRSFNRLAVFVLATPLHRNLRVKLAYGIEDRLADGILAAGAHGFLNVFGLHAVFDHTLDRGDHAGQLVLRVLAQGPQYPLDI